MLSPFSENGRGFTGSIRSDLLRLSQYMRGWARRQVSIAPCYITSLYRVLEEALQLMYNGVRANSAEAAPGRVAARFMRHSEGVLVSEGGVAMRRTMISLAALSLLVWTVPSSVAADCCEAPDNGSGTVLFPADCPYDHPDEPMLIVDGLPPGDTLVLAGPLTGFYNVSNMPGGTLGGEICTFDAFLDWTVTGTGGLMGFNRHLSVPVSGVIHIGPRTPGDSTQSFDAIIQTLDGELFGDPDFCTLRIRAGDVYGIPGPGWTMLTALPDGDFNVDSFFDITYQIEFEGCPGSQLDGYMGATTASAPRTSCNDFYLMDWCRLQWPTSIEIPPGTAFTVYGRFYIPGVTDQSTGNDPSPGRIRGQIGYGPIGTDPSASSTWTWFEATPNPAWDGSTWGEPDNDEYMAQVIAPSAPGDYDYCCRFSGDVGHSWLYGDKDTGLPGEDGSENGYQTANAGKLTVKDVCCYAPDNGMGTVAFPPDCPYGHPDEPMVITAGLPPGDTLVLAGPITDFYNVASTPGGDLGGEVCTFDASLDLTVNGTGGLTGFSRHLYVPVSGRIHIGPRTPGDSLQFFEAKIDSLYGELFGDPDFCTFRIKAGEANGLPCPGQTLLTELPNGDFAVESFFDVSYALEFEGCPGSQLDDYAGTTFHSVPRTTCDDFYGLDWCRLQWPLTVETYSDTDVLVYGRFYIAGVTDQTQFNNLSPGRIRGQVGYGAQGSDPSVPGAWTWIQASPNPGWDGTVYGEPNNDEYWATMTTPGAPGAYDYAYRFSGDAGHTWVYADKNTGLPGEDGSENGYQPANAGKMDVWGVCCAAPDNGSGTTDFPPSCDYDNELEPMYIIDGLPPGTTIELWGPLTDFTNVVNMPGGTLGGEICTFDARFDWTVEGTGSLVGFNRHISMPVSGEIHIEPRNPGDPVQNFDAIIYDLYGELFGDPDFCELRVEAGSDRGLPSSGQTQLTELPSGDFAVDSFFDITYRIEFEGCPGSQLDDYAGTTTGATMKSTCWNSAGVPGRPPERPSASGTYLAPAIPNPFSNSTVIAYGIAVDSRVTVRIYEATGRLVSVLVDSGQAAGNHFAAWNGTDDTGRRVASGIYFCRLAAGPATRTQRIVLLR
jgi:hypothetical protein